MKVQFFKDIGSIEHDREAHLIRKRVAAAFIIEGFHSRRQELGNNFLIVLKLLKIQCRIAEREVYRRGVADLNGNLRAVSGEGRGQKHVGVDELEVDLDAHLAFEAFVDESSDDFKLVAAGGEPDVDFLGGIGGCGVGDVVIVKERTDEGADHMPDALKDVAVCALVNVLIAG